MAPQFSGRFPIGSGALLATTTRGPVANDHVRGIAIEHTANKQLIAGPEGGIRHVQSIRLVGMNGLLIRVIDQGDVHASTIRRILVDDLIVPAFERLGMHQILHDGPVHHLANPEYGQALRVKVLPHRLDDARIPIQLAPIPLSRPFLAAIGQEFPVVRIGGIDGIVQVLDVVETNERRHELRFRVLSSQQNGHSSMQKEEYGSKGAWHTGTWVWMIGVAKR